MTKGTPTQGQPGRVTPAQPYYRFRSRARYLRARGDFLGWYLAHTPIDEAAPFDRAAFSQALPPESPLLTALDALPETRRPRRLVAALQYLRVCLHMAEQDWPPAESLEATLSAARPAVAAPLPVPPPVPAEAPTETPPPKARSLPEPPAPAAPPRRSRWRWMWQFFALLLIAALAWISGRATQTGLERQSIAADLDRSLPDLQAALSGLSLSLPAQAAACFDAQRPRCLMDARGPSFGDRLRRDLGQAQDAASRMLADLSPLDGSGRGALWFVAAPGENCILTGTAVLDADRDLIAGLCRVRERLTEYDLCLSGHPVISDRQCRDLMRLAIADTLFDCTNCGDRPANVFDQRIEWRSELEDAAGLVRHVHRFAAPIRMARVIRLRLENDALWLRSQIESWRDQVVD